MHRHKQTNEKMENNNEKMKNNSNKTKKYGDQIGHTIYLDGIGGTDCAIVSIVVECASHRGVVVQLPSDKS